jgi:hypothetical protein
MYGKRAPGISATSLNDRQRALVGRRPGRSYEATATGRVIPEHLIRMMADVGDRNRI